MLLLGTLSIKRGDQFHKRGQQLFFLKRKVGHKLISKGGDVEFLPFSGAKGQPVGGGVLWLLLEVMVPLLEIENLTFLDGLDAALEGKQIQ